MVKREKVSRFRLAVLLPIHSYLVRSDLVIMLTPCVERFPGKAEKKIANSEHAHYNRLLRSSSINISLTSPRNARTESIQLSIPTL